MPEEEIKKTLKELAESEENKAFLKDLAGFDSSYKTYMRSINDLDEAISEDGAYSDDVFFASEAIDSIDSNKEDIENDGEALRKSYGPELSAQLWSFFEGPKDTSDEKVLLWAKDNYYLIRLFACSSLMEAHKEINNNGASFFDLCTIAEKMPAIVSMAKMFMCRYHKEAFTD